MDDYRWLTSFFSRIARIWRPPVQQVSRFLDLPLDIIHIIFDNLPLSSKILLSQTCRALWREMHEKCFAALQQVTADQRLMTLADLGNLLPDQYLCVICNGLHHIDYLDFPGNGDWPFSGPDRRCARCELWENSHSVGFIKTSFRHTKLATKYTRMDTIHQDYCQSLLRKHESSHHDYGYRFIAEPRVVLNRYILMATCIFTAGVKPYCFESLCKIPIQFCPHSRITRLNDPVNFPFASVVQQAFYSLKDEQVPQARFLSCDYCPTDISILIEQGKACIVSFSDLGTGESPEDPYWKSHIEYYWKNGRFKYDHGSIRGLYTSCPTWIGRMWYAYKTTRHVVVNVLVNVYSRHSPMPLLYWHLQDDPSRLSPSARN